MDMLIVLKLIVCKFGYVFKIGILEDHWVTVFRIMGALLMISGIFIWFTGAVRSDMDDHIESNKLKTSGIYAWISYRKKVNRCIPWKPSKSRKK